MLDFLLEMKCSPLYLDIEKHKECFKHAVTVLGLPCFQKKSIKEKYVHGNIHRFWWAKEKKTITIYKNRTVEQAAQSDCALSILEELQDPRG